jgi:hypothetical protein
MTAIGKVSDVATLKAEAQARTGLQDFGDPWIFENLAAMIQALNEEGQLNAEGVVGAQEWILRALYNRLAHHDLIRRHPEILDEQVTVAAIVVGLPRTGSTMLHRMLCAAPGMTGMLWWETQNYAPPIGTDPHDPEPRREAAKVILDYMLEHAPDLMSIHPMSIDQPDEELIAMGQVFSSTMPEGMYFIPSYSRWLMQHDRMRSYADLKQMLQSLQWQNKSRRGAKWVLKTPGHLMGLEAALKTFPGAKIVMTHRDPVSTVPSYASMEATLYQMGGSSVDRQSVGKFWAGRLHELLSEFMRVREHAPAERFVDVPYTALTSQPIEEGKRVLEAAGVAVTPEMIASMHEWSEANRREDRAPHKYTLEEFGLDKAALEESFAFYRERFLTPKSVR